MRRTLLQETTESRELEIWSSPTYCAPYYPSITPQESPETAVARRSPEVAAQVLARLAEFDFLEHLATETRVMTNHAISNNRPSIGLTVTKKIRSGFLGKLRDEFVYDISPH